MQYDIVIEQEQILEHGSDKLFSSDSEVKIYEHTVALGGNSDARKNQDGIWSRPIPFLEFLWCQPFHWRSQWTGDKSGTLCEQKLYNYNLFAIHMDMIC